MDDRVLKILGYDKIKEMLADCAVSERGAAAARALLPATERQEAERLMAQTREAESISISNAAHPMMGFDDLSGELTRLKAGAGLSCAELLRVSRLMKAAKRAKKGIKKGENGQLRLLPELADQLFYDDMLIRRIDDAILSEEEIADQASPALRDIRRRQRNENAFVREKLNAIIRSKEHAAHLQDAIITMRNGRYVVPVKQEYRGNVPGLIHGQSASGATLFIEPMSIVEANNRLRVLEEEEKQEIERILLELSALAGAYTYEMQADLDLLTYLDLVFAKAALAIRMRAMPIAFNEDDTIDIRSGRHPLIDEKEVIPVSVSVSDEHRTLIITGPNTGGKTVTLKMVGLFSAMAQSGLFLPALEGSSLPLFEKIFADIGDEQSIEQSLSTFSSHMRNIIYILRKAGAHCLVLIDEMGAGTDPEEGTALALAILDELNSRGCKLLTTTHYSEIKAYAMNAEGFENASMEFDAQSLRPTYRLIMGVAGSSNAFLISKRLGLKTPIIEKAKGFMRQERLEFDSLILQAERTRKQAERELERARQMQEHAKEVDARAKKLEKELADKRKSAIERANKEALEIVKEAQEETEQLIKEARKLRGQSESQATKTTEKVRREISAKKEVLKKKAEPGRRPAMPANPAKLSVGQTVHIYSLDVDATVSSLPDAKGMVGVQAGIMSMNVHLSDLELRAETGKKKGVRTSRVSLSHKSVPLSINLHGYTVEEAILEVDRYLDDAFLAGLSEVSIIHGKGTGALRSGVQNFLRRHPHAAEFRLGKFGEGEDGVTIVTLK